MHKLYIWLIFLSTLQFTYGQVNDNQIRVQVLKKNLVGKGFTFVNKSDNTTTILKYLGMLKSDNGKKYKILNSMWLWGQSHRATSRILIYDNVDRYMGQYYVDMTYDLPNFIKNNHLVFLNSDNYNSNCDLSLKTSISFKNGLPKNIFIKCEGNSGDIFCFEKD